MRTRIQRWGNRLALRIPKPFAAEAGLEQQSEVDVAVIDRTLVITSSPAPTLSDLLAQVTDENLYGEVDSSAPVGREVWQRSTAFP
jgi:antitoxin component of MazEF toxin-antitoxin module